MKRVSVVKVHGDIYEAVIKAIKLTDGFELINSGDSVLIKSNIGGPGSYLTGGTTNPFIIKAVIEWCRERNAGEVIVGEGPSYGFKNYEKCFAENGVDKVVKEFGVKLVAFDRHGFRVMEPFSNYLPPKIGISQFVFDCDKVINVPVLKTHLSCLVTIGMKNLKGCVRRKDKPKFHSSDLDRSIVELNKIIKPDFTIVDGTIGMEGLGPGEGTPINLNIILAGKDVVAVDAVSCQVVGIRPDEIMMLQLASKEGLGNIDIRKIEIVGEDWKKVQKRIERPYEALSQEFPELSLISEKACSGCVLSFLRALEGVKRKNRKLVWQSIVIGKNSSQKDISLLIGNCTSEHWTDFNFVEGCPPTWMSIQRKLLGFTRKKWYAILLLDKTVDINEKVFQKAKRILGRI